MRERHVLANATTPGGASPRLQSTDVIVNAELASRYSCWMTVWRRAGWPAKHAYFRNTAPSTKRTTATLAMIAPIAQRGNALGTPITNSASSATVR